MGNGSIGAKVPQSLRASVLLIGSMLLVACGPTLDTRKVEETIQDAIIKQGGISLKNVYCPARVKPATGQSFECFGELDSGKAVAIPVKQLDDKGTLQWDVPSVRGLLNLARLEVEFQEAIKSETGLQPKIDCGSTYRAARPGESFECKVTKQAVKKAEAKNQKPQLTDKTDKKDAKAKQKKEQPDSILVSIDPEGNVNWQQVFQDRTLAAKPATATKPASAPEKPAPESEPEPEKKAPPPPAQNSAEDFLNQAGATDDFD